MNKRSEYNMQYRKEHIKRVVLDMQKSYFEEVLKPAAEKLGLPVNTFIKQAIEEKIKNG